jgi:hypothetical protein
MVKKHPEIDNIPLFLPLVKVSVGSLISLYTEIVIHRHSLP